MYNNDSIVKKVAAIHDLSGVGRCSLGVISPILSVLGHQVCSVPTAVLSTHTGGFGDVIIHDLTEYLKNCFEKYKQIGIDFDCIYTGYLASHEQIGICSEILKDNTKSFKVVGPVMGDHGKLYRLFSKQMQNDMINLVKNANLITPNITEACFLLGEEPLDFFDRQKMKSMLARLSEKGPEYVIITSVRLNGNKMVNVAFDKKSGSFWCIPCDYVPVSYPGTGDVFAAIVTGSILNNKSLPISVSVATDFLEKAIKYTFSYATDTRNGICFENNLSLLFNDTTLYNYEML